MVNMLRSLFTEFDKCCLKYKVYKVYTIGDCYVVMGFTNAFKRNPIEEANNVVKMGLSMIQIIRTVRDVIKFPDLDMRIGIHTVNRFPYLLLKIYFLGSYHWRYHWYRYR